MGADSITTRSGDGDPAAMGSRWRRAARLARPLILTMSAALAFAALLQFHNGRFEDGMVRGFQKQQLGAVRSLADSVEESIANVRRGLVSLASHPDVCRLAPAMHEALSAYIQQEKAILDDLVVVDTAGGVLWRSAPDRRGPPSPEASPPHGLIVVSVPVERDGRQAAVLRATVNLRRLAIASHSRISSAYGSAFWMLSDANQVVYTNTRAQDRRVVRASRGLLGRREQGRGAPLLAYVTEQCAAPGRSGLVEVASQDGQVDELGAYAPIDLEGRRLGLLATAPRADVSIPIVSHQRVTYALIVALTLLYFATGYAAYRSERAHSQLAEQRRRAAEEASRAKGDFLARMSHEIRTPMNGVISMTELAISSADEGDRRQYMGVVRQCARSLLSVINDVLDISRIEARRLDLRCSPFNVQECVVGALASLASLASSKGLYVRWNFEPGVPSVVWGDPGRLRQILLNLVGNALKFTTVGGVGVKASPEGGSASHAVLRLEVADSGPGMSPEHQKRLFSPYYQCADNSEYRPDSTGLGLAIARQLVELMGGHISLRSAPGEGTAFTFTVRLALAGEDAAAPGDLPALAGLRALIVSDAPADLQRFHDLLASWGAQADMAHDPPGAMAALQQAAGRAPYALVLIDCGQEADAFAFAQDASACGGHGHAATAAVYRAGLHGEVTGRPPGRIDAYAGLPIDDAQLHLVLRLAVLHATTQGVCPLVAGGRSEPSRRRRVLLVEDNPVNRQAASILLRQWGHAVHEAQTGEDALAAFAGQDFDVVLMDLQMPGMNGLEATREIRRREKDTGRHVPIVAMTAHAMDRDIQRCLEAGMDRYVSKPFAPEQLRGVIEAVSAGGDEVAVGAPALLWDRSEALRLANGNADAVAQIVGTFLDDLRRTLPRADEAALARDAGALAALAHRWKGSLGLLGARRAQSRAARLEELCRLGEPERLPEWFAELRGELLELQHALSRNQEALPCGCS